MSDGFILMLKEASEDGTCIVDGIDYAGVALERIDAATTRAEAAEAQVAALREALEEIEGVRPFCCEVSDNLQGIARAALEEK